MSAARGIRTRHARLRLAAMARDRGVRRSADRARHSAGNRVRRRPGRADDRARPARGSRSGSTTWSCCGAPGPRADAWPSWDTSGSRSPMPWAFPCYAHPGGIFPRIATIRPRGAGDETGRGLGSATWRSRSNRSPTFSRAHDLGLEILGYPLGPYRVGDDRRRSDEPGRGRAARLPGVRALPRRAGARGTDDAARRPRRPGRPRPLGGPAAPVRRRRARDSTPPRRPSSR